jgi:TM2 domain-containing membrane protein YozV/RNA polymerase subunit RPABC4/transcription elongation factor Spt4
VSETGHGDGSDAYCISCGEQIDAGVDVCPECGVGQSTVPSSGGPGRSADEKYCTSCGTVLNRDAELCPDCGVRQTTGVSGSGGAGAGGSDKDRVAAALLALLLGGIGAHKFYLGQTKLGLLYLCFFWTVIPAIVGFIEGIIYLVKSEEEFQRQYA